MFDDYEQLAEFFGCDFDDLEMLESLEELTEIDEQISKDLEEWGEEESSEEE